jgi:hypothetical protein
MHKKRASASGGCWRMLAPKEETETSFGEKLSPQTRTAKNDTLFDLLNRVTLRT